MTTDRKKTLTKQVKVAKRRGWDVTRTGSGHLRFAGPDGTVAFTPSTPGRSRSIDNSTANLRRAGLDLRDPDPAREERRARALAAARAMEHDVAVLECLQSVPGGLRSDELAERTGIDVGDIRATLHRLVGKHPEIDEDGELWAYDPAATEWDLWRRRQASRPLDLASASYEQLEPLVASAAPPEEGPSLFEPITGDEHGRLLLRDDDGGLWLALRVEPSVTA